MNLEDFKVVAVKGLGKRLDNGMISESSKTGRYLRYAMLITDGEKFNVAVTHHRNVRHSPSDVYLSPKMIPEDEARERYSHLDEEPYFHQ